MYSRVVLCTHESMYDMCKHVHKLGLWITIFKPAYLPMAEESVDGLGLGVTNPCPVLIKLALPLPMVSIPALHIIHTKNRYIKDIMSQACSITCIYV